PRGVVVRRRDRHGTRGSRRPGAALLARDRGLPHPPLPRDALPVRRPRRRRARPGDRGARARAVATQPRGEAGGPRRCHRADVKIGIVGLPNAGKSTLFNALTRAAAETGDYAFTTIDPNVAVVPVPDERLEEVARGVGSSAAVVET